MTRRSRRIAPFALAVTTVVLAACGGSNNNTTPYTLTSAQNVLGQPGFTTSAANYPSGTASATGISNPTGVAYDSASGEFFLADKNNNRVLGYKKVPVGANNIAADFVIGQPDFSTSVVGSPTTQTNLAFPNSVSVGFDSNTGNNKLVVADTSHNRVLIWNTVPTGNVAPDVVIGQSDFASFKAANPPTSSSLSAPAAATIANGELFVADTGNSRVLIWFTVPTSVPAPPADLVLGQPSFTTGFANAGTAASPQGIEQQNTLNRPQGIWSDGFRLLVTDTGNNRVLLWTTPSTIQQNADVVIGQSSFTFSTTAISSSTLNGPTGVSSDGARIFIADAVNNRVLVYNSFPGNNGVAANEVLGQENFTHNVYNDDNGNDNDPQTGVSQPNPTQRTLSIPQNVIYINQKLYVLDASNNRVMIFDGVNIPVPGNS